MEARTHTLAKGWMRLETLPSSLTSPSSKRWLVDDRNSTTRNAESLQSVGSCGSRSASDQVTVETSVVKSAFCGTACATQASVQVNASNPDEPRPVRQTIMLPPGVETGILGDEAESAVGAFLPGR